MPDLVDSCGWLSYFLHEPVAPSYAALIDSGPNVYVSVVTCYEVYRRLLVVCDVVTARKHVAFLHTKRIAPLTLVVTEQAAEFAHQHKLHMADALIYATAQSLGVDLWTHDTHFQGLPGVHFVTL